MSEIPRGDAVSLTRALVRADSRNPGLVPGGPGERGVASLLFQVLPAWGFRVEVQDALPGRPNVVARIGDAASGATLMLNGHIDVVGVEGMTHEPLAAEMAGGRIYGRGATDMKGGVASMCAAAARAAPGGLRGEVIVAAVCDEEFESAGTSALIARGIRADAAIVTEPTKLAIMPAHRGFVWITVEIRGRAAHGSRYDIGIDAVRHAGLLLAELDVLDAEEFPGRAHGLVGRPSLHASTIEGGIGWSTYPDRCVLTLERRTVPGETKQSVAREIEDACDRVRSRRSMFDAVVTAGFGQPPSDLSGDAPVAQALKRALGLEGLPAPIEGMSAWTDAALLNAAGIPALCFGPGDISLAHAATEWVEVREIELATNVLERVVKEWCR